MIDFKWSSLYNQKYWPKEVAHIMRIAEETTAQTFLFDLPWDMERTYEPIVFEKEINWEYMPGNDPEFIYQLNRHRYWICLGQAYAMTEDEKYAKTFFDQLMSWIDKNPLNSKTKNTTWRTIEAGLRGENWTKAIKYFEKSPYLTEKVKKAYRSSLAEHGAYLAESYSPFRVQSNWGVLENSGLFAIALALPKQEQAEKWKTLAIQRLTEEIQIQVTEEGVHWEQSPMYHNEVLHCYLETIKLAKKHEVQLPDILLKKTRKMACANLYWKKPNHCQPAQGDSDETDVRDIVTLAAEVFLDGILKYGGYDRLDFESIWELGEEGASSYNNIERRMPERTEQVWKDSGDVYLRSDWGESADYLHFHCGFLGSGHGHGDKTHLDLVMNGEDVLVDCGRYHYVDGEKRRWFKGLRAHNCICVDGKDAVEYPDAWSVNRLTAPINQIFRQNNGYFLIEGGHLGYQEQGVLINRKIISLESKLYLIVDESYTEGRHTYQQYFHCHARGNVTAKDSYACYEGTQIFADFFFITPNSQVTVENSEMSSHYNLIQKNQRICVSMKKQGFASMLTVIAGRIKKGEPKAQVKKLTVVGALDGMIIEDDLAEAVEIAVNNKTYVVMIKHQEIGAPATLIKAEEQTALARITIFDKDGGMGTVLSW